MSDNLKDSMTQLNEAKEQEMKARSMALQSQINPHFYYNSLSSIMVLAENGDTDTVEKCAAIFPGSCVILPILLKQL